MLDQREEARIEKTSTIRFRLHKYPELSNAHLEGGMVVARFGEAENGKSGFNGDRVSIWEEKQHLEVDGGDGYTTV